MKRVLRWGKDSMYHRLLFRFTVMDASLSKWRVASLLLIGICFLVFASTSSYAATQTYTLSINSAASIVHTTGGLSGWGEGDLSISGTFQAVITDGAIGFRNVNIAVKPSDPFAYWIIPGYPGTATQTGTGYTFSGSKIYDNSTGGGNFSGSVSSGTFSLSGSFNAPCCDFYNYQFVLNGTAVLEGCSFNADCKDPLFYCAKAPGDCQGQGNCQPRPSACIDLYAPVCGCDGLTYGNACEAAGAGVSVAYQGVCAAPGCGCLPGECPSGTECIGAETLCLVSCTCPMCAVCAGICCGDNNFCTMDSVDPASGCVYTPKSCPTGLTCDPATGNCIKCTTNAQCNDNNACTTDTCDTASGNCFHAPVPCPTGMDCEPSTGNCVGCMGPCISCNSDAQCLSNSNACSRHTCDLATGFCVDTLIRCNDNNACTIDSCDPIKGCVYTWLACPAFSPCTTDGICDPATGTCVFPPIDCNDNNICTTDTCDPATGICVHTPVPDFGPAGLPCDDGNLCTTGDVCSNGVCVGIARNCNDNNLCTTDTCDPASGCKHTPKNCDDNDACTADTCNPSNGKCVHTPIKKCKR